MTMLTGVALMRSACRTLVVGAPIQSITNHLQTHECHAPGTLDYRVSHQSTFTIVRLYVLLHPLG
jgi:hypothetical protein